MKFALPFLSFLLFAFIASAQAPSLSDLNEGLQVSFDGTSYSLSWWGRSGRTYFIQQSDDLINWQYVPIIESGADDVIEWGFTSSSGKSFFRLRHVDIPTSDPANDDFDGDGVSNMQELLNGSDPLDFYNGSAPGLQISIGNGQWGTPGAVLATPVSIAVNSGSYNAPVNLSVASGGALLSADALGTGGWQTNLPLRATATYTQGDGSGIYVAQAYVLLPSTVGNVSTLVTSASSGGQTATAQTWVATTDSSMGTPHNLATIPIAPGTVSLTWTPSDITLPTTLQVSLDSGFSWLTLGTATAGVSSATITGLPSDSQALFRAQSGGTPGGSTTFDLSTSTSGIADGTNYSQPSEIASATPLSQPLYLGEVVSANANRYGWRGFGVEDPTQPTYLEWDMHATEKQSDGSQVVADESLIWEKYGNTTSDQTGDSDIYALFEAAPTTIIDPADASYSSGSSYPQDTVQHTLKQPYASSDLLAFVNNSLPSFTDVRIPHGPDTAYYDDSYYSYEYNEVDVLQFQWQVNSDPNLVVSWDVVFTPIDGSPPTHNIQTWASNGDQLSPVFSIDLRTGSALAAVVGGGSPDDVGGAPLDGGANVVPVGPSIVPDSGMEGVLGGMVPSNKVAPSERHFVTPKVSTAVPGDYAVFRATGVYANQFGVTNGYSWQGGEAYVDPITGLDVLRRKVTRGATGKTQLKLIQGVNSAALLNVWVVWCDVQATPGTPNFTRYTGRARYQVPDDTSSAWKFLFTIQPPEIIAVNGDTDNIDRPALDGALPRGPQFAVPGASTPSPTNPAVPGDNATTMWDVSRKMKWKISIPFGLAPGDLTPPVPVAFTTSALSFPAGDAEGNDDPGPDVSPSQHDNPYVAKNGFSLDHSIGQLSSKDAPIVSAKNSWGAPGRTFSFEYDFQEFARLFIWDGNRTTGTFWFRISDFSPWHHNIETSWDGTQWTDGIDELLSSSDIGNTN